jgi:hypothetical protein
LPANAGVWPSLLLLLAVYASVVATAPPPSRLFLVVGGAILSRLTAGRSQIFDRVDGCVAGSRTLAGQGLLEVSVTGEADLEIRVAL